MNRNEFIANLIDSSIAQLGHPDEQVRGKAESTLEDLIIEEPARAEAVIEGLANSASSVRLDCVQLLAKLVLCWREISPVKMKGIGPALLKALDDPHPSVRREALCALEIMPSAPDGWEGLLARLAGDPDLEVRREAIRLLGMARTGGQEVIHGLAAGLQDSDSQVRMEAAMAFCYRSGWPPGEAWLRSTFLESLDDSNPRTRSLALHGVWQTDWRAESSMAAFLKRLEDEDLEVRRSAVNQILNVALNSPELARPAVPALLRTLDDPQLAPWSAQVLVKVAPTEPTLRAYLKSLLEKIGGRAAALCLEARVYVKEVVKLTLADLRDSTWDTQFVFGAGTVHVITPRDTAAKALLEHALPGDVDFDDFRSIDVGNDPILEVQLAAIIVRLFPGDMATLEKIAQCLQHREAKVREQAAWTLPHTICADARIVPLALNALGDSQEGVRAASIYALSKIEKPPLEALPLLIDHLRCGNAFQKDTLLKLIASLGREASSAAEAVLDVMNSPEESTWSRGLVTLVSIRATESGCVPHYVRGLMQESAGIRMWALLGLQVMGSAANSSLSAITKAIDDPSPEVRIRAVTALATVGREHPGTKASLARVARTDHDERVRRMAAYALGWLPSP